MQAGSLPYMLYLETLPVFLAKTRSFGLPPAHADVFIAVSCGYPMGRHRLGIVSPYGTYTLHNASALSDYLIPLFPLTELMSVCSHMLSVLSLLVSAN